MGFLLPLLPMVARSDAGRYTTEIDLLFATLQTTLADKVRRAFDGMSSEVDRNSILAIKRLIGIDPSTLGVSHVLDRHRDENIQLVEKAARVYAKDVRDIFENPLAHTMRVEDLKKDLLSRGNISKSRAELIARDQVLKLNSQLNETRQRSAGVSQYRWSTSQDERVRPDHAELEGTIHDWNNPPVVDKRSGRREHPGNDYQCRCLAQPIIEGLD